MFRNDSKNKYFVLSYNMDKRKLTLLNYLTKCCSNGYTVLEIEKVLKTIKKYKNNFDLLSKDVEFLYQRKFIDLKYLDTTNLCYVILDNSRIFQENLKLENSMKGKYFFVLFLSLIISGISSFVGAFLAILLFR